MNLKTLRFGLPRAFLPHALRINFCKARVFRGQPVPWHIQVVFEHRHGSHTLFWIRHNPFKAWAKPDSDAANRPVLFAAR